MSYKDDDNVRLFLYEFHLNKDENVKDGIISETNYGKHVVDFMETTFGWKLSTMGKKATPKVSSETMTSEDGTALLYFRMYDRRRDNVGYPFLLTLALEVLLEKSVVDNLNRKCQQFSEDERKRLSDEKDGEEAGKLAPDQETVEYLPVLHRGFSNSPYFKASDDRVCHYAIKEVLYNVRSKYQHIEIYDLVDQGRTLFLDGLVNLGECDVVGYTHALMDLPKETDNYAGSEVLILGGGDGSLLKELLELPKPPKKVIMIDLDEAVMTGCAQHMRSVCGPYMDHGNRKGENYEVICGDALEYMENAKKRGEKFDFIFGDLTDVPVDATDSGANSDLWKFFKYVLTLGMQVLKPNTGKYMTHCTGKSAEPGLANYEEVLKTLKVEADPTLVCKFTQTQNFVQSFLEIWVFYQISMVSPS